MKAFIHSVLGQLHEREFLQPEQRVLKSMARKAAEGSGPTPDWDFMQTLYEGNIRRLAEIDARRINRIVFPLRRRLLALPKPVSEPLRAALRRIVGHPPAPKAAVRAPARLLPLSDLPPPSLREPVAVVMHLFYPELASEMRAYLEIIPGPVDR